MAERWGRLLRLSIHKLTAHLGQARRSDCECSESVTRYFYPGVGLHTDVEHVLAAARLLPC
jgi:hypothetical protein